MKVGSRRGGMRELGKVEDEDGRREGGGQWEARGLWSSALSSHKQHCQQEERLSTARRMERREGW